MLRLFPLADSSLMELLFRSVVFVEKIEILVRMKGKEIRIARFEFDDWGASRKLLARPSNNRSRNASGAVG